MLLTTECHVFPKDEQDAALKQQIPPPAADRVTSLLLMRRIQLPSTLHCSHLIFGVGARDGEPELLLHKKRQRRQNP